MGRCVRRHVMSQEEPDLGSTQAESHFFINGCERTLIRLESSSGKIFNFQSGKGAYGAYIFFPNTVNHRSDFDKGLRPKYQYIIRF